jgi:hypothetical protein
VVSNLQQMPGVVRLDPASEVNELLVTFNADQTSPDAIVAQLVKGGDEVKRWEFVK